MTCIRCREYRTEGDDALCARCLTADYVADLERARRLALDRLPPDARFLLDVARAVGMTGPRATELQRALTAPEPTIPAVFAHLMEAEA